MDKKLPHLNTIIVGDSTEILRSFPPMQAVILTDPVWPNTRVSLHGSDDPFEALRRCAAEWPRIARAAIVHLGCDSDPRILWAIPKALPFVRVAWMRYARPHYKGNVLYGADVAYIFGDGAVPQGRRLLPGECCATDSIPYRNGHPCPRKIEHVSWLVASMTKEDDIIIDPFFGSGTTARAAEYHGRKWIGIEINPEYVAIAEAELAKERAQLRFA